MEGSDSDNEFPKDPFSAGKRNEFTPKKVESEHFRKKTQPERESPQAKRCIFKQEQQKFEAVLVISVDENENSMYQLKEDMIYLPEHPKQVFETEIRQEYLEMMKEAINRQNWTHFGRILAKSINQGVDAVILK